MSLRANRDYQPSFLVQDRIGVVASQRTRLAEAIENALRLGNDKIRIIIPATLESHPYSSGWHCAHCDVDIRPPSPGLFSFNNPLGACPACRGFGELLESIMIGVFPDKSLSIKDGVVRPFQSGQSQECQTIFFDIARKTISTSDLRLKISLSLIRIGSSTALAAIPSRMPGIAGNGMEQRLFRLAGIEDL